MLVAWASVINAPGQSISKEDFNNPPIRFWPRPLWFWNNAVVNEEGVSLQMQEFRDKCGYGGFGIVPFGQKFKPEYLTEAYFKVYGKALEKAKELGMTMCMYDEFGFPSGGVGAVNGDDIPRFQLKFPQETIKRLDKIEEEINGPAIYEKAVPNGKLMGVVAMESVSLKRTDLSPFVKAGNLKWNVPPGKWKIMFFLCVDAGEPIADYLSPEAVRNFIEMTHEAYYSHFRDYFGTVIFGSFFDEPSMFHAQFRMWTDGFNNKFNEKYGFSPVLLYPALWYDIGSETQSARNAMFGFRAELYAEGFTKQVNDWSVAHGIKATGHTAPEEVLNPVNSCGDLMKSFKYLQIPGIDKIGGDRPAERFYKVISSSAYNWDKPLVMSETYGAMPNYDEPGNLTWNQIFSIAMDQYSKGINMLIPHAVWYDNQNVTYKPELSDRNPLYADSLKAFTQFLARLNVMLQNDGRHVADIAILYPIHSLQGEHYFDGPAGPADEYFKGDPSVTKIDYVQVSNWITEIPGLDFTFLHPEILDEKCRVSQGKLHLQNVRNWEDYQAIIVPACKTISVSNLQKIAEFYKQGGIVMFTSMLPLKSYESGQDKRVLDLVKSIFPDSEKPDGIWQTNSKGGKALFIGHPDEANLRKAITDSGLRFDIQCNDGAHVRTLHKVLGSKEIFYFANPGDTPVNTQVTLRGKLKLEAYDPHSGEIKPLETVLVQNKQPSSFSTSGQLTLKPYHSCFWVGDKAGTE
jgi:hypothetical protein